MRVLLLGGSGLLSGAAVRAFQDAGHELTVLTRGQRKFEPDLRTRALRADRTLAHTLVAALQNERFDFTADFLAFDAADVERLFAVPGFDPGRLVVISSGQVYLVTAAPEPPFREADADRPLMSEPVADTRDHREWTYGIGKRAVEAALARVGEARGLETLALRLPVVQGEADGRASKRLWAWLERLRDGGPVLLPDAGVQPVRFVYAGDVARALVRLAEIPSWPAVPALNFAQPDECSLAEFLEHVARLAGVPARFVAVGGSELIEAGLADTCAPYWGRWSSRLDPGAAEVALGMRALSFTEYLPWVVRAHLETPSTGSHPGYAHRAREIALAERPGANARGNASGDARFAGDP